MVEGGWITLSGDVWWEYQRAAAVAAVRPLRGVVGVSNHIVVKPSSSARPVRADIEAALKRRLHCGLKHIAVGVNGSDVKLSGIVPNWWEREVARNVAWSTPGVHKVLDNLIVAPAAEFSMRAGDSDAELRLDGEDDALYQDGLTVGDDSLPLAGTDGDRPKGIRGRTACRGLPIVVTLVPEERAQPVVRDPGHHDVPAILMSI